MCLRGKLDASIKIGNQVVQFQACRMLDTVDTVVELQ